MKSTVALLAMLFASPALALAQLGEAGPAQPPAGSRPQSGDEQALSAAAGPEVRAYPRGRARSH